MPDESVGIKQADLKNCVHCKKGVCHNQDLRFFRFTLEDFFINTNNIREQAGLEMMIGGQLAAVMGPNQDIANRVSINKDLFLCGKCMYDGVTVRDLFEK